MLLLDICTHLNAETFMCLFFDEQIQCIYISQTGNFWGWVIGFKVKFDNP